MPYSAKFKDTLYNPEWLREQYEVKGLSCPEIGDLIGCDQGAVNKRLKKIGVRIRSHSENAKNQDHPGSHASRRKSVYVEKFKDTLDNDDWLRVQIGKGLNASEISVLADASVPTVQLAMERIGVTPPNISEAKAGRPSTKRVPESEKTISRLRSSYIARTICPLTPCVVCRQEATQVNHINRNWRDNSLDNLEWLCAPCHTRQYKAETEVMYRILTKNGEDVEAFRKIFEKARELLLEGPAGYFKNKPLGSLEYNGETKSLSDWAVTKGIKESTLRMRLHKGMSIEQALNTPVYKPTVIEYKGVKATLAKHARVAKIPYVLVHNRVHNLGWTVERALSIPLRENEPSPSIADQILAAEEEEQEADAHPLDKALEARPLKPPTAKVEVEDESEIEEDFEVNFDS